MSILPPMMVYVNAQQVYLNAEKKLNVHGTFGSSVVLVGVWQSGFGCG